MAMVGSWVQEKNTHVVKTGTSLEASLERVAKMCNVHTYYSIYEIYSKYIIWYLHKGLFERLVTALFIIMRNKGSVMYLSC